MTPKMTASGARNGRLSTYASQLQVFPVLAPHLLQGIMAPRLSPAKLILRK